MSNKTRKSRSKKNVVNVIDTTAVVVEQAPLQLTHEQQQIDVDAMLLDTAKAIGATQLAVIADNDDEIDEVAASATAERDEFSFIKNTRSYRINVVLRNATRALTKREICVLAKCTKLPRVWARRMQDTCIVKLYRENNQYVYAFADKIATFSKS